MTTERATVTHEERRSWIPMIGLFLAQILMPQCRRAQFSATVLPGQTTPTTPNSPTAQHDSLP